MASLPKSKRYTVYAQAIGVDPPSIVNGLPTGYAQASFIVDEPLTPDRVAIAFAKAKRKLRLFLMTNGKKWDAIQMEGPYELPDANSDVRLAPWLVRR